MGYGLYREILDYAPDDWTSSERLVACVIADDARDSTRASMLPNELLCKRTGLGSTAVRKVLRQLAARGYEMRVSHGDGKDGRPVFAVRGHRTDYIVPSVDALIGATGVTPKPVEKRGAMVTEPVDNRTVRRNASDANGHQKGVTPVSKGVTPVSKGVTAVTPLPSYPLITSSTEERAVVTTSVEGNRLSTGPPRSGISPAATTNRPNGGTR